MDQERGGLVGWWGGGRRCCVTQSSFPLAAYPPSRQYPRIHMPALPCLPALQFSTCVEIMRDGGVPLEQLRALGLREEHNSVPYGQLLRSLPEEDGVQLEFWRSAPGGPRGCEEGTGRGACWPSHWRVLLLRLASSGSQSTNQYLNPPPFPALQACLPWRGSTWPCSATPPPCSSSTKR